MLLNTIQVCVGIRHNHSSLISTMVHWSFTYTDLTCLCQVLAEFCIAISIQVTCMQGTLTRLISYFLQVLVPDFPSIPVKYSLLLTLDQCICVQRMSSFSYTWRHFCKALETLCQTFRGWWHKILKGRTCPFSWICLFFNKSVHQH